MITSIREKLTLQKNTSKISDVKPIGVNDVLTSLKDDEKIHKKHNGDKKDKKGDENAKKEDKKYDRKANKKDDKKDKKKDKKDDKDNKKDKKDDKKEDKEDDKKGAGGNPNDILFYKGKEPVYDPKPKPGNIDISEMMPEINKIPRIAPVVADAEGPGYLTQGGTGGRTLYVTTTEDYVSGSLRWALGQSFPRIIKFKVGGFFSLSGKDVKIKSPRVTLDGSDAPSPVVIIDTMILIANTYDVIIRHVRCRPGDRVALRKGEFKNSKLDGPADAITVEDSVYVLIDHVSASHGTDELISVTGGRYITVQRCLIAKPLNNPLLHIEDGKGQLHAFGSLQGGDKVAFIKCVIAYFMHRGTQMTDGKVALINCIISNFGETATKLTTDADLEEGTHAIIVNNYYGPRLQEPDGKQTAPMIQFAGDGIGSYPESKVLIYGSLGLDRTRQDQDQWVGVQYSKIDDTLVKTWRVDTAPWNVNPVALLRTEDVYENVLADVGSTLPKQDAIDARIIKQVRSKKPGRYVKSQDDE